MSEHAGQRALTRVRLLGEGGVEHHPEQDHHGQAEVEREGKLGEQRGSALLPPRLREAEGCRVQDKLVKTVSEGSEGKPFLHPLPPVHPHELEIDVAASTVNFSHRNSKLLRITLTQPT